MPAAPEPDLRLPLVFLLPPGWPTPSVEWVVGHLGWEPPTHWVPTRDCPAAPRSWVFWRRNGTVWRNFARQSLAPAKRLIWTGLAFFIGGVVLTLAGYAAANAGLRIFMVFTSAIILGPIQMIVGMSRLKAANLAVMEAIRQNAPRIKVNRDRMAYQNYLRSTGSR